MAEYDAGTVKATMKADGSGLHSTVETAKRDIRGIGGSAKEAQVGLKELGLSAGVVFGALTAGIFKTVSANNQLKASFLGLDSVATGNIGSYEKIKKELQKIQEDGLIPLTNATQAYKNLISRYKDEETAIRMFNKIADAAAFGRQAHLSLGEAIQGTSEGLKNEMSNMVDNGGITKNLSVMWKEYANQLGKGANSLTEAEKHQAEINGFMTEGRFQTGDLAKLQQQLAGQMSKVSAETNLAAAALGDAYEPAGAGVAAVTADILKGIREFINANPTFVAGVTAGTLALTGLAAAGAGWNFVWPKVVLGLQALKGGAGIALIAVSALTAVVVGYVTAAKKAREENIKLADKYRDESVEVKDLINEYKNLQKIVKPTADQKQRMYELSKRIAEILPNSVTGYDNEHRAIINVNTALREMILLKGEELRLRLLELDDKEKDLKKQQRQLNDKMRSYQGTNINALSDVEYKKFWAQYEGIERKAKGVVNSLQDVYAERKAINDLLKKGITSDDIKPTTKPKPTTTEPGGGESGTKDLNAQLKLQDQLLVEHLERIGQLKQAEVEKENQRYKDELETAKDNKKLIEQVRQAHTERLGQIDKDFAKKEEDAQKEAREKYIKQVQDELDAKRQVQEQALSNLEAYMQHEIEMGRATSQDLIGFYEKVLETQNLSEEEYIQYYRKLESLKKEAAEKDKAVLEEQKTLMDDWQQKAEDVSRTTLERRLDRIEREREETKEAATDIIQDQTKLKQTLANIDEVYDDQRLQAIVESLNEEYKLKEDMTAEEMKLTKKALEAKLQALEADATASKEQIKAYKKAIAEISKSIGIESDKTNAQIKENTADLVADLVLKKKTIKDIWQELMEELVRQYIKKFIFGIESESGNLTKIFDNIFNGSNSSSGTSDGTNKTINEVGTWAKVIGAIGSIFKFSEGGIVPKNILAAANGMIVPNLPDSFGTDRVLSALTPQEMVLPVDISKYIIDSARQSKNNNVKQGDVHFHFNCIDGENAAKFIYDNRDSIVGIVQSNRKNGGVLRGDVD